ncbi:hypothetical protein BGX26_012976 [Mortierella sp. AD094]|nr:hypothetical protein BGX26_012976 [Mortierella sp. AD094]
MSKPPSAKRFVAGLVLSFVLSLSIAHAQSPQPATPSSQTESSTALSPTPTTPTTPTPTPTIPIAITGIASVTGNGVIFYQGGLANVQTIQISSQLFSLDTTKIWSKSFPAWTNLTNITGGPTTSGHSATMSSDLTRLYVTAPTSNATINVTAPFLYEYDVKSNTWSSESAPSAQAATWFTRKEASMLTDPSTGAIWYLGGIISGGMETNELDRYQGGLWNTNIPTVLAAVGSVEGSGPSSVLSNFSSGTSHIYGTKIYLFGGFSSASGSRSYRSFQSLQWVDISTATPTVGTQLTLGSVPPPRQDHCSVLTASNRVIIYGGYDANTKTAFDDVWSLDFNTLTWQQILPIGARVRRYGHNCNLAGANMIVFAGFGSTSTEANYTIDALPDVQVYDVMTSRWMDFYIPKNDTTPLSVPGLGAGLGNSTGHSRGFGAGALVGIVIGCVTLIGSAVGIVVYKKRQNQIKIRNAEMEKEAYLVSVVTDKEAKGENDGSSSDRRQRQRSHYNNPYAASAVSARPGSSTRRLNGSSTVATSPGASHYGFSGVESHSGRDDDLTTSEPEGGVQYLMQQLPDGSIAVQPVYLNHQPFQFQQSPNIAYSETSSLGGIVGASLTRASSIAGTGIGDAGRNTGGFVVPSPPVPNSIQNTEATSTSDITPSGYAHPPSANNSGNVTAPPPTHNPFASPSALSRAQSMSSSRSSPRSHRHGRDSLRQTSLRQARN